jgi:hypothetical protein
MIQNPDPNDPAKLRFAKARYRARLRYSLRYPRCPQQIRALPWCGAPPSVRMLRKAHGLAPDKPEPLSPIVALEHHRRGASAPPSEHSRDVVRHSDCIWPREDCHRLNYQIGFYDRAESRRSSMLAGHGVGHFARPERNVIAHLAPVGIVFIRRSKRVFGNSYRLDVTILPEKVEHNDPFHSRSPHARLNVSLNACLNCYFGCRPRTCVAKKACARTKASALAATLALTLCRRGPGSSKSWVAPG